MKYKTIEALKQAIGQLQEYRESQVICSSNLGFKAKYATDSIDKAINQCKEALDFEAYVPTEGLFVEIRYKEGDAIMIVDRRVYTPDTLKRNEVYKFIGNDVGRMLNGMNERRILNETI